MFSKKLLNLDELNWSFKTEFSAVVYIVGNWPSFLDLFYRNEVLNGSCVLVSSLLKLLVVFISLLFFCFCFAASIGSNLYYVNFT